MNRIVRLGTVGWIAVGGALAGCGGQDDHGAAAETPITVGSYTVAWEEVELRRAWIGRLEPLRSVTVQAPRDGRVEQVSTRDGDRASAGDVLFRLSGTDQEGRRDALETSLAQLEGELARWERLAASGAAGPGEVAAANLRVLDARAQLAALESYEVRSPSTGRVYGTSVAPGTLVSAGHPLAQVEDGGSWGVRLSVAAWEAPYFEDAASLSVQDGVGRSLTVERVAASSELHPGFVRIDLYLTGDAIARGSAEVQHRATDSVLLVPWTAVADDGDRHWVAVLAPGDPQRIERRIVELGRPHATGLEVLAGLQAGDRIVRYEPRSHPEGRAVVAAEDRP